MIDLVIPLLYGGSKHDDFELRYMLRSMEQNADFDFRLILITDKVPDWIKPDISIVKTFPFPHEEMKIQSYETFYNTIQKLEHISKLSIISDAFIYAYDDIILNKKIELDFFLKNYAIDKIDALKDNGRWAQTIFKADKITGKNPFYNYEHHIPVRFDRLRLKWMFDNLSFRGSKIPYAPISVYFNTYFEHPDGLLSQSNDIISFDRIDEDKIWLNYRDSSFKHVYKWIEETFAKPSRYEK